MTYGLIAICPYVIRLGLWARNARTGFRFVETPRSEVDLLLLSDANGNMTTGTLANHWTWDALKRFDPLDPRCVMEITFEVARLGESLSRSHQDAEKTSCPARWRRPLACVQQFPSCLMFAGFKRIAPEQDTGMDLNEPWITALELFSAEKSS